MFREKKQIRSVPEELGPDGEAGLRNILWNNSWGYSEYILCKGENIQERETLTETLEL